MLHRLAISLIVAASALTVSRIARADLFCPDVRLGYMPDEMTSTASQALASDARSCVCDTYCSTFCKVSDGEGGDACYFADAATFGALVDFFAPPYASVDACETCIDLRCGAVVDACMADG